MEPAGQCQLGLDLVFIAVDGVLSVGGVVAVVVNGDEADVPVHEADNALGIAVEGAVFLAGLAFVPGEGGVGGPFHDQEGALRFFDGGERQAGNVGHRRSGQGHAVENVAGKVESAVQMKRGRVGVAAVRGAGEHGIPGRRFSGQAGITLDLLLVEPPGAELVAGRGAGELVVVLGGEIKDGLIDFLEVGGANGQSGFVSHGDQAQDEDCNQDAERCHARQEVGKGEGR